MNSGQPDTPIKKDSGEPFCWILRPTLQLKIKDSGEIKANSWNEFRPTPCPHPPRKIQVNPSAEF